MLQIIWHHFSVQFSLIFQMVYLVLPSVLHFKTSLLVDPDWLLKVFHQSGAGVSKSNTASKMEHSTWKSNENWTENWCHIVCSILSGLFLCVTSSVTHFFCIIKFLTTMFIPGPSDLLNKPLQCFSCGSLLDPSRECDKFNNRDPEQVQTCAPNEACLLYAWEKSPTETCK